MKAELVRDGVPGLAVHDWETVCQAYGADVEAMHRGIEVSRINRLDVGHLAKGASHA